MNIWTEEAYTPTYMMYVRILNISCAQKLFVSLAIVKNIAFKVML